MVGTSITEHSTAGLVGKCGCVSRKQRFHELPLALCGCGAWRGEAAPGGVVLPFQLLRADLGHCQMDAATAHPSATNPSILQLCTALDVLAGEPERETWQVSVENMWVWGW